MGLWVTLKRIYSKLIGTFLIINKKSADTLHFHIDFNESFSWDDSLAYCNNRSQQLAVPDSLEKHQKINDLVNGN